MKDSELIQFVQKTVNEFVNAYHGKSKHSSAAILLTNLSAQVAMYNTELPDAVPAVAVESTADHRSHNVGESDYASHPIQPWDCWINWGMNPWDADMLKRLIREKLIVGYTAKESRIQDYKKIQHLCDERITQIEKGDPWYKNLKMPKWLTE